MTNFLGAPLSKSLYALGASSSVMTETLVALKLNFWEGLFLSMCAGIGEELLFRSGIQPLLGPVITSILFIALHGYLNPFNWRFSIYGLIALPFILLISYSVGPFGLWFAIAAHFSYDAVLFTIMMYENKQEQ